jgi:hypothetical protein
MKQQAIENDANKILGTNDDKSTVSKKVKKSK